ncbi:MAG: hypothetical protein SF172_18695 [Burkholderiales bacterium]|nr:hypothetical protein [Burkholderiales bacterium]
MKTAKGAEEIAQRTYGLPARQRTLLILVDGRNTLSALMDKAASLGHDPASIRQLESSGFIMPIGGMAATPVHVAGVPKPPSEAAMPTQSQSASTSISQPASRQSLALARMYLADSMGRIYGARSDAIRESLRTATTRDAILVQLEHCVGLLSESAGAERGEALRQRVMALLPSA